MKRNSAVLFCILNFFAIPYFSINNELTYLQNKTFYNILPINNESLPIYRYFNVRKHKKYCKTVVEHTIEPTFASPKEYQYI